MSISDIQTDIIKELLAIKDRETLLLFKEILANQTEKDPYILSSVERSLISESLGDYQSGKTRTNDAVFNKNEKWLNE